MRGRERRHAGSRVDLWRVGWLYFQRLASTHRISPNCAPLRHTIGRTESASNHLWPYLDGTAPGVMLSEKGTAMGDDVRRANPSPAPEPAAPNTSSTSPAGGSRKTRGRKSANDGDTTRSRSSRNKSAPAAPSIAPVSAAPTPPEPTSRPAPRIRRGSLRGRAREPGVMRLAERARLIAEHGGVHLLADPLTALLPAARNELFNSALDVALHAVTAELASTLAPAVVQVWIADAAPWS